MPTSTQAIKLKFGRNKFGKRTERSLQTRLRFNKMSRDIVDEIIDQIYPSKIIPKVRFNFIS